MAKRLTDTNKYKKPFIRALKGPYKLLWDYLYHECDHAGIWIIDFEIAQIYLGYDMPVNKEDALKYFNAYEERIIEFDEGKKWFIKSFVEFQYGILNEQNRVHNSVLNELKKYNLDKALISPLQGLKDKEKDKEKDKDKDKGGFGGKNDSEEKSDFIDSMISIFQEVYEDFNQVPYIITNKGKERSAAGKLAQIYRKNNPDVATIQALESMKTYFRACVSINDDWLRKRMSLSVILDRFTEINNILKNGNRKGSGATNAELASIVAKHFGE